MSSFLVEHLMENLKIYIFVYYFFQNKNTIILFVKMDKTSSDQHLCLVYLRFNVPPGQWFRQRARDPDQFSGEADEHEVHHLQTDPAPLLSGDGGGQGPGCSSLCGHAARTSTEGLKVIVL